MAADRQEQRDFLLRACHDLRASLRAVRTSAELAQKAPEHYDPQRFAQIVEFMVDGVRKADSIVDALVNYALALRIHVSPMPVDTGVVLRGVLTSMAAEIRESAAEITHDTLPQVTGDPDRLIQLFENLIRNAIRHGGQAAPRVHVSARREGGAWIFAISDNGRGIESADLDRIFRPFERLRSSDAGVGLGLTICREIVSGHGGRIWAESTVGAGTSVYFTVEDR